MGFGNDDYMDKLVAENKRLKSEIELKKDLIQMSLDHIYRYGVALDIDKVCSLLEKALSAKEDSDD